MTSHCTQKAFTSEHKPQALFVVHSAERAGHGYVWSRPRRWISDWSRCRRWISRRRRWNSLTMIIVSSIMFFHRWLHRCLHRCLHRRLHRRSRNLNQWPPSYVMASHARDGNYINRRTYNVRKYVKTYVYISEHTTFCFSRSFFIHVLVTAVFFIFFLVAPSCLRAFVG